MPFTNLFALIFGKLAVKLRFECQQNLALGSIRFEIQRNVLRIVRRSVRFLQCQADVD